MNEKINKLKYDAVAIAAKELKGEVGDIFDYDNPGIRLFIDRMNLAYEKFAELIIKECINECEYAGDNDALRAAENIKEHFGIKE